MPRSNHAGRIPLHPKEKESPMPTETPFNGNASTADDPPALPTIVQLPASQADLPPPSHASAIDEAEAMIRAHYDDIADLILSLAGLSPSINGSPKWDEAAMVFKLQAVAAANGYAILAAKNTSDLAWCVLWGFRRVTKHSLRAMQAQGNRLLIEQRHAISHAAE